MRAKNVFRNLLSEILPQILITFLGIFKSKIFLQYFGSDIVGLYQLFTQILGYLSLVEGGLGTAVIYRLYKPIFEKDYDKLAEIRAGIKKIFNIVIIVIFVLGIIAGFIIPYLIKDNVFSTGFILLNFMIYVISELMLYKTVFERSLFTATEKNYKLNLVVKSTLIIKGILEIILAIYTKNITNIFIMFIIINALSNYIIYLMAKREFKFVKESTKRNYEVLKDVKNLLAHKIAGLVSSNIDTILLSCFMGLKKVVIYSTYLLYTDALKSFMNKISNAFLGSIGNKILEDKEDSYRIFKEYNALMYFIAMIVGIQFFFSINSFIDIWYSGQVETNIIVALFFTLTLIYGIIRIPLLTYTESAGLFKETKICPILEAIINLIISLMLIKPLGMIGLLIGTVIALIVSEFLIKPSIIFKNIFNKKVIEYYKINFKFIMILLVQLIIVYFIILNLNLNMDLYRWAIYSVIFGIINIVIVIILFIILKQNFIIERIKQILKKH